MKKQYKEIIEALIMEQKKKLLSCAHMYHPNLCDDDLLQPNDFPELEHNPFFRYEEGILAGMQMVQSAMQAMEDK